MLQARTWYQYVVALASPVLTKGVTCAPMAVHGPALPVARCTSYHVAPLTPLHVTVNVLVVALPTVGALGVAGGARLVAPLPAADQPEQSAALQART